MPKIKWFKTMEKTWTPGEEGAKQKLDQFLNGPVDKYKTERDFLESEEPQDSVLIYTLAKFHLTRYGMLP